ncbi:MAG: DUF3047 domain-containing protein [Synoicihabitans sp.]
MIRAGFLFLTLSLTTIPQSLPAETVELFESDADSFHQHWEQRGFPFIAATEYGIDHQADRVVVTGRAQDANRALARRIEVELPTELRLSWEWRVRSQLTGEIDERTKAGDDFAARVFVVFETSVIPTRTRAINYVWSAQEPVGSVFPSPYTRRVAHIVLRNAGSIADPTAWLSESRDVLADYQQFFGEPPSVVTAVAIMVDTDNTDGYAEADFRELILEISPAPEHSGS